MTEGIDFSYARPGGKAIAAAGKAFVVRYIRPGDGRSLTAAEIADYRAHGLDIALVFEAQATRPLDGLAAGMADAKQAQAQIVALGIPTNIPVYFAVDFNASLAQQPAIDNYLRGAASVIGLNRVGVYGGGYLLARCRTNKTATWFWQCASTSWGPLQSFAHLHQYRTGSTTPPAPPINGGAVDLDTALQPNFGQWPATGITAGGMQSAGETMISAVQLTSTFNARVTKETPILKGPGDPLGANAKVGYVYPYIGIPDGPAGLRAVLVPTAIPFADKGVRPCVLYLASADVVVEAAPVVPAPVDQSALVASLTAKLADANAQVVAATATSASLAAKISAAAEALK
jgi:hypothetical protein